MFPTSIVNNIAVAAAAEKTFFILKTGGKCARMGGAYLGDRNINWPARLLNMKAIPRSLIEQWQRGVVDHDVPS